MKQLYILIFIVCMGCIEPYEFVVKNDKPTLVVEGYISNVSYSESVEYPSNGHYFTIELRKTSDVTNLKDEVISNASVKLVNDAREEWIYIESSIEPGKYLLNNKNFKAIADHAYQLQIELPDGSSYTSEWEKLPKAAPTSIGSIGFEETTKQVYAVQAGERVVETIKGINVYIDLPANQLDSPIFYRWDFLPTWIYIAPLASSRQTDKKCWATNEHYLSNYTLQIDHTGGYRKNLFFIETVRNERIFEDLSVLIRQYAMTEEFYYFWKEMKDQSETGGIFDNPPFNLRTNIKSSNSNEKVSGYFGVVDENATRWYFNLQDLSYYVQNTLRPDCLVDYGGPPAPSCLSCLEYFNGSATNVKPGWWK